MKDKLNADSIKEAGYTGGAMHLLAEVLLEQFEEDSLGNFITLTLTDGRTDQEYELVFSKVNGTSTTNALAQKTARIEELEKQLAALT